MGEASRAIFRTEAVNRYIQGREKAILPRLVRPPVFLCLWLLLAVLLAGGLVAGLARVPVYASGIARVHPETGEVILLMPAENRSHLQAGQRLFILWNEGGEPQVGTVTAVETPTDRPPHPQPLSPEAGARGEMVMVKALLEPGRSAADSPGRNGQVRIEIGSTSLLSLVPFGKQPVSD